MIPAIARLPRITLGNYPTPLVDAEHLSAALGGPRILIKREDLTGLALGGNKCRKLEFIIAEARQNGIDTIITTGGTQSNFALQMAAAARKFDMEPYLVLAQGAHAEVQGNLLLHDILGSNVKILELSPTQLLRGSIMEIMHRLADELTAEGRHPLVIPAGAHNILGTTAWVDAVDETWQQLQSRHIDANYLVVTNGSGSTQAGLDLGVKHLRLPTRVIGFSIFYTRDEAVADLVKIANDTARFLDFDLVFTPEEISIYDEYNGEGYGITTPECIEAIKLVARTEGIFLDPVYTGKAMAGLIDFIRQGRFTRDDTIVFFHTGGIPALFAYAQEITG